MDKTSEKQKEVQVWKIIVAVLFYFAMLLAMLFTYDLFEAKLGDYQVFDMKLYLLYTIFSVIYRTIGMVAFVFVILWLAFVILSYIAAIKKDGEWFLFARVGAMFCFVSKGRGMIVFALVMLLVTLFWPIEEIQEYRIGEERVLPIKALEYQIKDLQEKPIRTVIKNGRIENYTYTHIQKRGTSETTVRYLRYEWDGKEYVTPCTTYMYRKMLKLSAEMGNGLEGQDLEVYLFPNTGMIVDFAETPPVLKEEQEQLQTLLEEYGYPYRY